MNDALPKSTRGRWPVDKYPVQNAVETRLGRVEASCLRNVCLFLGCLKKDSRLWLAGWLAGWIGGWLAKLVASWLDGWCLAGRIVRRTEEAKLRSVFLVC